MRRLVLTLLAAALVASLAAPAASSATPRVALGLGDQRATVFDDPRFRALRIKKVRYFVAWNAIRNRGRLAEADAYVAGARRAGVRVLMHVSSDNLRRRRARLPSVAQYRRNVGALVRRYRPQGVREWGTWNEANHDSQPTYRNPRRAAQFYVAMRGFCRGCTIVGLDLLDQRSRSISGFDRYIRAWFRAAGRSGRALRVVGIHNYSETNRFYTRNTRDIIRAVRRHNRRTKLWFTETGGIAKFGNLRCNYRRQARATRYMLSIARRFRRDVTRLYPYNFYGTNCRSRFDAGLVNRTGSPRPAYRVLLREGRRFGR
ncbi:MAG: hypothetical protein M3P39_11240 [Actinomycetota bacterium]|nr:hypothetical protein [Actinomycetota bacterium]